MYVNLSYGTHVNLTLINCVVFVPDNSMVISMEDQLVYEDGRGKMEEVPQEKESFTSKPMDNKGCNTKGGTSSMSKKKGKKVNKLRLAIRKAKKEEEEEEIEDPTMRQKHETAADISDEPNDEKRNNEKKLDEIDNKIEAIATSSANYIDGCIKNLEEKLEANHSVLRNEMINENMKLRLQQDELSKRLKEIEDDNAMLREQIKRNEDVTRILQNVNELGQEIEELKVGMIDCKKDTENDTSPDSSKKIRKNLETKRHNRTKGSRNVVCKYLKNCKYGNKCHFLHPGILGPGPSKEVIDKKDEESRGGSEKTETEP